MTQHHDTHTQGPELEKESAPIRIGAMNILPATPAVPDRPPIRGKHKAKRPRTKPARIGANLPASNDNQAFEGCSAPIGDGPSGNLVDGIMVATDLPQSIPILEGIVELVQVFWPELLARLPANDNSPSEDK